MKLYLKKTRDSLNSDFVFSEIQKNHVLMSKVNVFKFNLLMMLKSELLTAVKNYQDPKY